MQDDHRVIKVDFKNKQKIEEPKPEIKADDSTEKLLFFTKMIDDGETQIHFTSCHHDVQVHKGLQNQTAVAMNWSYGYGLPDFSFDEDGVRGTLSVSGVNGFVSVPWTAVFGICSVNDPSVLMKWPIEPIKRAEHEELKEILGPDFRTRVRKTVLRGLKKLLK